MTRFIFLSLVVSFAAFAAPKAEDQYFKALANKLGDYHQQTTFVAASPKDTPKDLESDDPKNTLNVRKLADEKFSFQIYSGGLGGENAAASIVLERNEGGVTLTYVDLATIANSYRVTPRFSGDGTQMSYYNSDVQYLETSPQAVELRKGAAKKRKGILGAAVLGLALLGIQVPAEIINSEDSSNVILVQNGAPILISEILLDARGKSELHPKGEESLTMIQAYHLNQ